MQAKSRLNEGDGRRAAEQHHGGARARSGVAARWRALTAAVWLFATSFTPAGAAGSDVADGRALAERLCADCHLNPGQGDKSGPGTVPGFAAVAVRPGQTHEGIVDWLKSTPPMMPNHHLSQEEMQALAAFIMSLQKSPARPSPPQ
ncbi:MAG: c-type cytochrome [Hyphomicrobiaceae bacterium]|nr:c-type cytochrome [Hyphomicrobiaceae bacterium]